MSPRADLDLQPGRLVAFVPWRCPSCRKRARRGDTSGPHGRLRYHRCRGCGSRYRSCEVDLEQLRGWDLAAAAAPSSPDGLPLVPFLPARCPTCGSVESFTYGMRPLERLRYHRCKDCRGHFRSREVDAEAAGTFNGAEPAPL